MFVLIHGNIFLKNKIKIKLLLAKNPALRPGCSFAESIFYYQIFVGIGVIKWCNIPLTFLYFIKRNNLEIENVLKSHSLPSIEIKTDWSILTICQPLKSYYVTTS